MTRGRPKMEDPRSYRVNLRLSDEQKKILESYCVRHNMKKTEVFMKLFNEIIAEEEKNTQ